MLKDTETEFSTCERKTYPRETLDKFGSSNNLDEREEDGSRGPSTGLNSHKSSIFTQLLAKVTWEFRDTAKIFRDIDRAT